MLKDIGLQVSSILALFLEALGAGAGQRTEGIGLERRHWAAVPAVAGRGRWAALRAGRPEAAGPGGGGECYANKRK